MCRAALAQVDLDRVRGPRSVGVAHRHEVDGEATDHTLACEPGADDRCVGADRRRVRRSPPGTGSRGSSVRSARRAPGRGSTAARPHRRCDAQLHARAADLDPGDRAPRRCRRARRACSGRRRAGCPGVRTASAAAGPSPRCAHAESPGCRKVAQVDRAHCPEPETPSFSLTMTSAAVEPLSPSRRRRRRRRRGRAVLRTRADDGHPPRRTGGGTRSSCRGGRVVGRRRTSGSRAPRRGHARARSCCTG